MKKRNPRKSDKYHQDTKKSREIKGGKIEQGAVNLSETPFPSESLTKSLRDESSRISRGHNELQLALDHERAKNAQLAARCSASESQYARLARFYVATQRLLDAQSREELFETIHEIVASLIGCEEFGIFRIDERCTLSLASSCGIDVKKLQTIPLGSSLIGTIALKGEAYFIGGEAPGYRLPQEADLSACIPLKRNDQLFGAIAIFRLLPQKTELQSGDKELLSLLGRLAAVVLLGSSVFCHTVTVGAKP